jgi:hypothetical protein
MRIDIKQSGNVFLHYQVKITEQLKTSDKFHTVGRVTTSPEFLSERVAREWLIKYLNRQ